MTVNKSDREYAKDIRWRLESGGTIHTDDVRFLLSKVDYLWKVGHTSDPASWFFHALIAFAMALPFGAVGAVNEGAMWSLGAFGYREISQAASKIKRGGHKGWAVVDGFLDFLFPALAVVAYHIIFR